MRFGFATWLALLLLCTGLLAQMTTPSTQIQTFHVRGTVRDSTGAPIRETKVKVTFRSASLSQTVSTNDAGAYEADLPLGVYNMSVDALQFRPYRRPAFRVTSPINVTINATLPHNPQVTMREYGPTAEERAAARNITYYDGDFFSVPADDGAPFRLYISYVKRIRTDYSYDYVGDNSPPYDDPVFAAYNLFSLQANTVLYDMESRRLDARGNVVVEDESGKRSGDSMSFKIENGRAIALP
jgi:hypothetical protein